MSRAPRPRRPARAQRHLPPPGAEAGRLILFEDVILIPRGHHPVAAAAGYDAYYLNVMAGRHRDWRFTLDPDHAWLMDWDPTSPQKA